MQTSVFNPELFTQQQWAGLAIVAVALAVMLAMLADAGKPYKKPLEKSRK